MPIRRKVVRVALRETTTARGPLLKKQNPRAPELAPEGLVFIVFGCYDVEVFSRLLLYPHGGQKSVSKDRIPFGVALPHTW